jgi:hypothetical protein
MKKMLEAVLVLAALALGVYVVRAGLERRELAAHPPVVNPASAPGADVENPDAPSVREPHSISTLPAVKLSRPAKPVRRAAVVPPPVSSTP